MTEGRKRKRRSVVQEPEEDSEDYDFDDDPYPDPGFIIALGAGLAGLAFLFLHGITTTPHIISVPASGYDDPIMTAARIAGVIGLGVLAHIGVNATTKATQDAATSAFDAINPFGGDDSGNESKEKADKRKNSKDE